MQTERAYRYLIIRYDLRRRFAQRLPIWINTQRVYYLHDHKDIINIGSGESESSAPHWSVIE